MPRPTMPRSIALFSLLALLAAPAASLAQEEEEAQPTNIIEEEEELYCDCGGDEEMSILDEAYDELDSGHADYARDILVDALARGDIESYERAYALSTLAEAQLQLGDASRAILNFRRALALDLTERSRSSAEAGLAASLYRRYRRDEARELATTVAERACAERWSERACYTAQAVLSVAGETPRVRAGARAALETLRGDNAPLIAAFDAVDSALT